MTRISIIVSYNLNVRITVSNRTVIDSYEKLRGVSEC